MTNRTKAATEARMRTVDLRLAKRLKERGWLVAPPCESHGVHPHDGARCLDCPVCGG